MSILQTLSKLAFGNDTNQYPEIDETGPHIETVDEKTVEIKNNNINVNKIMKNHFSAGDNEKEWIFVPPFDEDKVKVKVKKEVIELSPIDSAANREEPVDVKTTEGVDGWVNVDFAPPVGH